jgi:nicotinamide-nucleotide amidase
MAAGAARLFAAHVAVAITGAAGPDSLDGASRGTIIVATDHEGFAQSCEHHVDGVPDVVCRTARDLALSDLLRRLEAGSSPPKRRLP